MQPLCRKAARFSMRWASSSGSGIRSPAELRPALAYGYSDKVLAQLPTGKARHGQCHGRRLQVGSDVRDQRQRSGQRRPGGPPADASGLCRCPRHRVAARQRTERSRCARVATIFAAQLAQLTTAAQPAAAGPQTDLLFAPGGTFRPRCFTRPCAADGEHVHRSPRRHPPNSVLSRLTALSLLLECPRCHATSWSTTAHEHHGLLTCDACGAQFHYIDDVLDLGEDAEARSVSLERKGVYRTEHDPELGGSTTRSTICPKPKVG